MKNILFIILLFSLSCSKDTLKKDSVTKKPTPSEVVPKVSEYNKVKNYQNINFLYCEVIKSDTHQYLCPVEEDEMIKTLECKQETNVLEEELIVCLVDKKTISFNIETFSYLVTDTNESSCKAGGIKIFEGNDVNKNGQIEENENKSSEVICKTTLPSDSECNIKETDKGTIINCSPKKLSVPEENKGYSFYDPCGLNGNEPNEVFIKISEKKYLAVFNNDNKESFLVNLSKGDYYTNDSQKCHVTVNEDGSITEN